MTFNKREREREREREIHSCMGMMRDSRYVSYMVREKPRRRSLSLNSCSLVALF